MSNYVTKNVWLGPVTTPPELNIPSTASGSQICADQTVQFIANASGGTSYQWVVTGGTLTEGQGTQMIKVVTPPAGGALRVQVRAENTCGAGTGNTTSSTFNSVSSINGFACYASPERRSFEAASLDSSKAGLTSGSMDVYPNPGSDLLYIKLNNVDAVSNGTDFTISLYDSKGKIQRALTVKQDKLQLGVSGLPSGIYYLSVSYSNKIIGEQVIIWR